MKNTKYMPILLLSLLTVGGFLVASNKSISGVVSALTPSPTSTPRFYAKTKDIPDELAYGTLFTLIKALGKKDTESFAAGQTTKFKESFYENQLGLDSTKFSALTNLANDYFAEILPVDQSARNQITQYRAANPGGILTAAQATPAPVSPNLPAIQERGRKSFEKLPPPPSALIQLQAQKKQIILSYKTRIETALGSAAFVAFNSAVHKNATRVLVPVNLGINKLPYKPTPTPTPSN
jgi:hypothetical protein